MPITTESVRTYYDQNTRLFLNFSGSKKAQNIHRSLWADDVSTLEDALNYSNSLILREIESLTANNARIADLGCGVGASLFYIYPRLQDPKPALGLTLSPVQASIANKENQNQNIYFAEGDFTSVPLQSNSLDVIYSVEAVCHAVDPESYFREAARLLRKGGKLILVDDYHTTRTLSAHEQQWMNAYVNGWHVPGVRTVEQVTSFAQDHQLKITKNQELTPLLRLRNLPHALANALLSLGENIPVQHAILPSMLGSMALQQCLHMKIVEYRFLVFEKN